MMTRRLAALAAIGVVALLSGPVLAEYFVTDGVDAARRGDYHAVHRLIQDGADIAKARDEAGFTALHWAGVRGYWRSFRELIEAGADVNAVGGDGGTPLHWACHHDNVDMVKLLLDAGADVNVDNRWGRTPLHVAVRRGCSAVASLLIVRGADPNAVTKEGWTPLHVASMSGQPELVELLLLHGADASREDGKGRTAADVERLRPREVSVDAAVLEDYVGLYDLDGATGKVWREGKRLRFREFAPDDLYPIAKDSFYCRQEPWRVDFVRGENGEVSGVEVQFLRRTVTGTKKPSPRYVGSAVCMSCHMDPPQNNPSISWMRSRHGHAYWNLGSDWSFFLAKLRPNYQDMTSPIDDERCHLCHTAGKQDENALFAETYRKEEGVSCEACHGPGSLYIDPEIMANREAFLANGGVIPDENVCRSCHRRGERFDMHEFLPKIAHSHGEEES